MGATFRVLKEQGYCDMGYGMVHQIRHAMLRYIGAQYEGGMEWADRYTVALTMRDGEDIDELFKALKNIWENTADENTVEETKRRRLWAVIEFCDHPDCGGEFYNCKDIAEVLALSMCMENIPESVKCKMERLQELFAKAGDDGFVRIT